jgi:hypothetical protein
VLIADYGDCVCNNAAECPAIGEVPINNHGNCSECDVGTPCKANPDVEGGKALFQFASEDVVIDDLSVREFFEGILVEGQDTTIDNVVFDGNCDDGLTNGADTAGTIVRDSTFLNSPDKSVTEDGDLNDFLSPNSADRRFYNTHYENVDWIDSATPIRVADTSRTGRYRFVDSTMAGTAIGVGSAATYTCSGPKFSGAAYVLADNLTVTRCVEGMFIAGEMEARIQDSTFSSNQKRGVAVVTKAKAVLNNCDIENNGTRPSGVVAGDSPDGNGGVSRRGNVVPKTGVDLGGGNLTFRPASVAPGSSVGWNDVCPNSHPASSNSIGVDNEGASGADETVKANKNCWCNSPGVANQKLGLVTHELPKADNATGCGPQL